MADSGEDILVASGEGEILNENYGEDDGLKPEVREHVEGNSSHNYAGVSYLHNE